MSLTVRLLRADGALVDHEPSGKSLAAPSSIRFSSRVAYAAAHVVVDPVRTTDPISAPVVDWAATLRYREYLWSLGFRVAEAMDTAQRGMGLDWTTAKELIARSACAAKAAGGAIASGAGTDHLDLTQSLTLHDVLHAYEEQCAAVEAAGSRIILMASRALARIAKTREDYASVYGRILQQANEPMILHWLGPMFDPELEGYWGSSDLETAMRACLDVIHEHADKVDGIKISLLDADLEVAMRRELPKGVRMYTGDDFNYDTLILGDGKGHSDALLGIFDAIAPAAALALDALDQGNVEQYRELLSPTVSLSRHIFQKPTFYYKTGLVFLAWLNGFQSHFRMVGGQESARSIAHLCELYRLADCAGLLRDPELAATRMRMMMVMAGIA